MKKPLYGQMCWQFTLDHQNDLWYSIYPVTAGQGCGCGMSTSVDGEESKLLYLRSRTKPVGIIQCLGNGPSPA